jgi:hypothetical protein
MYLGKLRPDEVAGKTKVWNTVGGVTVWITEEREIHASTNPADVPVGYSYDPTIQVPDRFVLSC